MKIRYGGRINLNEEVTLEPLVRPILPPPKNAVTRFDIYIGGIRSSWILTDVS